MMEVQPPHEDLEHSSSSCMEELKYTRETTILAVLSVEIQAKITDI